MRKNDGDAYFQSCPFNPGMIICVSATCQGIYGLNVGEYNKYINQCNYSHGIVVPYDHENDDYFAKIADD